MTTVLDQQTGNEPQYVGRIDDGHLVVQVLNGPGVWVGPEKQRLRTPITVGGITVFGGFFIQANMGVVSMKWSGDAYLYNPTYSADNGPGVPVYVTAEVFGCQD